MLATATKIKTVNSFVIVWLSMLSAQPSYLLIKGNKKAPSEGFFELIIQQLF